MANSVRVVEVCKVAPQPSLPADSSSATPPPPESLSLTFFDLIWLRFEPVQRLFFYESTETSSMLIPKLKASLSLTLQHFLPLAGNLTWPQDSSKPILSYAHGNAVSLTVTQCEDTDHFNHLISSNNLDVEAKEYHPLVPQLAVSHEKAAAMAFQVTIFPNRGFCIGTAMHHAILDGSSSTMFIKLWAHICKHGHVSNSVLPDELKPFFDRRVIRDLAGLEPIFLNQLLNMDRPNNRSLMFPRSKAPPPNQLVRGTFVFTRTKIQALRQLVSTEMVKKQQNDHQSVHLSTFCVTCAYIWICLVKANEEKMHADHNNKAAVATMGFTVDCRSRLDPPIPTTYFGNCVTARVVVTERRGLLGVDGLTVAVNAISEAIKSLDSAAGLLDGAENWIHLLYPAEVSSKNNSQRMRGTAGSPRFRIYETDFGWGRPKKVEIVSIEGTGAMSLSESKDGAGGIEVGLVLAKHHMQVFANLFAEGLESI